MQLTTSGSDNRPLFSSWNEARQSSAKYCHGWNVFPPSVDRSINIAPGLGP